MEAGEALEILIDNEISVQNVTRFLTEHQMKVNTENQDGIFRLTVNKAGDITEQTRAEEYCEMPKPVFDDYIVTFGKNIHGEGADEFGARLIQLFIHTLPDIDRKPWMLIFLNTCIYLTLKNSPVLEILMKLEKEELAVGVVSNMYEIMDHQSKAAKVLYP
jgi:hypothetical protein